eukprot:TRINITY_DN102048_c0_g1_i1.p1 TRINITY_DN102048_c0_g1~~TRINITY_DN102048_c0_g1_i1.p1  ORF type:complete len:379 (-),score=41.16 TRINITY_DN102048_c0_g1_i1:18-1154(-)
MFWSSSKYTSGPASRSGETKDVARARPKASATTPTQAATAAANSRQPQRAGEYQQPRSFGTGGLAPVLDNESRALHRPPIARLSSLGSLHGAGDSGCASISSVPRARQGGTPRSGTASVGQSGASTAGLRNQPPALKTTWPDLELDPRDIETANWWFWEVETRLAETLPDARCPYPWLRESEAPMLDEVESFFSQPFTFEEFKNSWNVEDMSSFPRWCEERSGRLTGRCNTREQLVASEINADSSAAPETTPASSKDSGLRMAAQADRPGEVSSAELKSGFGREQRCQSMSSICMKPPRGDRSDDKSSEQRLGRCASAATFGAPRRAPSKSLTPRPRENSTTAPTAAPTPPSSWRPLLSRDIQRSASSRRVRECYSAR